MKNVFLWHSGHYEDAAKITVGEWFSPEMAEVHTSFTQVEVQIYKDYGKS